jgi:hypothetical protein
MPEFQQNLWVATAFFFFVYRMAVDNYELVLLPLVLLAISFTISEPDFFHLVTAMGFLFLTYFCKKSLGDFFAADIFDTHVNMFFKYTIGSVLVVFFGVAFIDKFSPQTFEDDIPTNETQNEPNDEPDVFSQEDFIEIQREDLPSSENLIKPSLPSPIDVALGLTIPNLVLRDTPKPGKIVYDLGKQLVTDDSGKQLVTDDSGKQRVQITEVKYMVAANTLFTKEEPSWTSFFFTETVPFFCLSTVPLERALDVLDSNVRNSFIDNLNDAGKGLDVKSQENMTFVFKREPNILRTLDDLGRRGLDAAYKLFSGDFETLFEMSETSFTYFDTVCKNNECINDKRPCCPQRKTGCKECKMFGDPFTNLNKEELREYFAKLNIEEQDKMKRATDLSDIEKVNFAMFLFENNYKGSFRIGGEEESNILPNSTPFTTMNQQDAADKFIEEYKDVFGDMTTTSTYLFGSKPALVISPAGEEKTFRFSSAGKKKTFRFFLYRKTIDNRQHFFALEAFIFDVGT